LRRKDKERDDVASMPSVSLRTGGLWGGFKRKGFGRADWMGFKRVAAASNACVSEAMTFDLERLLTAKSIPDQVARLTYIRGFLYRLLTFAKKKQECVCL
jgi:hypothetical protein